MLSIMKVRNNSHILSKLLLPHLKWKILPKLSEMTFLQCLQRKSILEFHHFRFTFSKIYTCESEIIITSNIKGIPAYGTTDCPLGDRLDENTDKLEINLHLSNEEVVNFFISAMSLVL